LSFRELRNELKKVKKRFAERKKVSTFATRYGGNDERKERGIREERELRSGKRPANIRTGKRV
jgi:hypothetical protein